MFTAASIVIFVSALWVILLALSKPYTDAQFLWSKSPSSWYIPADARRRQEAYCAMLDGTANGLICQVVCPACALTVYRHHHVRPRKLSAIWSRIGAGTTATMCVLHTSTTTMQLRTTATLNSHDHSIICILCDFAYTPLHSSNESAKRKDTTTWRTRTL